MADIATDAEDYARALEQCASEPIRIPGSIQPQGTLLVLDPGTLVVQQAAVGKAAPFAANPLGRSLAELLPDDSVRLGDGLSALPAQGTVHLGTVGTDDRYHCIAHCSDGAYVVEFEPVAAGEPASFGDLHPVVRQVLDLVQHAETIEDLAALAAREVRRLTGLDRVLVYAFDPDWHGAVVAEDGNDRLPSYLGLRFPAADIPAQARELYRLNRLRLIADANYQPIPIEPTANPGTGQPIDLGHAVLRSVSPVHLEYMRNMGTMASMSISLLSGDRLWGLISCHHRDPVRIGYPVRVACDLIGQILSMQLAAKQATMLASRRDALEQVQRRLLARMASAEHFIKGLIEHPADLLALTGAHGAAVVFGEECVLLGEAPDEDAIRSLVRWLATGQRQDVFVSDNLAAVYPGAETIKDEASGLLAVSISQLHDSYVLWFRPEVIRTINWGGDPRKTAQPPTAERLHPRTSFAAWQETVRLRAQPWHEAEVEAASHLRAAIVDIVLRKAEELAALSERLVAINKELESFSYSVSHDLRAPFRHIVGYAQLLKKREADALSETGNRYIETIVESAISAGKLVDDLLSFSQMGRATLSPIHVDMNALVAEVVRTLVREGSSHRIEWHIDALPPAEADPVMIRLVLQNLIENAIKFSREREPAVISIAEAPAENGLNAYRVTDNGVGFDMAYVGKLFGVFQRLHRVEEFEGTGIGLANVKRIIERHGGTVWAEATLNEGATFHFTLPGGRKR
ncbi:light-regulated signal transduction histidine kinase (bacteriophytochrome) [Sphingomonas zeicaulis]|uniref:ATP-binding protein n=1 Tax=Sphingomonas zeicaulis TaxID=1632740 RepID=UPI003D2047B1